MVTPRPVVMQLTPGGRPHGYTDLTVAALSSRYDIVYYRARTLLLGRLDLVHLHWPENFARLPEGGRARLVAIAARLALLIRLRFGRTRLVRTVHNLRPHEPVTNRWDRWYLRRLERLEHAWIVLNAATPTPAPDRTALIPHPHYPMASRSDDSAEPGRIVYFGLIREYKNVPALVRALRALDDPDLKLQIVGLASPSLADEIRAAAGDDPRVELTIEWISDPALNALIGRSELIVLPYTEMHNSGAMLHALSRDRQVIAPKGPVVEEMQHEIGPEWVISYEGDLTAERLLDAIRRARQLRVDGSPDLSRRDPMTVAAATADVYDRVLATRRRRRSARQDSV